ncbi:hypothetical protein BGZ74_006509 [Mortierella antarctica]|nr:hypothetical protein BGZ74_006509 [Mortierella antarctica]
MPATYTFNEKTGVHRLRFGISWPDDYSQASTYYGYNRWEKFSIHGVKSGDTYGYTIKLDEDSDAKYRVFKSCSVSVIDGKWLAYNAIKILPNVVDQQFLATILACQLPGKDTKFGLEFVLTSNTVTVPPSEPVVPVPTLGEVILEKIFNDKAHEDVLFSFDSQSAMSEMVEETSAALDIASNDSVDTRMSVKFPQDSAMDPSKVDEDKDQLEPRVKRMRDSDPYTIGAHKLMLCQWPYFKAMFEGGFSEGGTGKKTIRIKDASPKAFHLLLRFMYTGKLPEDAKPTTTYMDPLNRYQDASWESVYLLAHRYDIQELTDIARASILSKLKPKQFVPFLFRTAYLFTDLREPVVKFVAQSCGEILASKDTRATYFDHPEGVQIFGELLEQMYAIKK